MSSSNNQKPNSSRAKAPRARRNSPARRAPKVAVQPDAASPIDADLCFICAEPVKYHSVANCNHRTCHVCALRLRALYKRMDCTFCKEPQPSLVFTVSSDALFSDFARESMPFKDAKLSIFFETQTMMEETLFILRYNCPDPECNYTGTGWDDLKLHVRGIHGRMLCDLCLRQKKVFAHEHTLYTHHQLSIHLPSQNYRRSRPAGPQAQPPEGGVHPLCEFCYECYFGDDELYVHLRERHEECFVCKRNGQIDKYFRNYESLERHFTQAHHPCNHPQCLAQKFVVFNTPLDLQAHTVDAHGREMSARDKKDARRVPAEFEFEGVGLSGRRGARREHDHERERAPSPSHVHQPNPNSGSGPPRPGGRRARAAFGSSLTLEGEGNSSSTPPRVPSGEISFAVPPVLWSTDDASVLQRHAAFISRIRSLALNSETAVSAISASSVGYRVSEASARDLISTIYNVLDQRLDDTASIVNAFVDLLEDDDKRSDLLKSWNGFKIEQRKQFPELVSTTGEPCYSTITSGQAISIKHRTGHPSRQVWDRVAQAARSGPMQAPSAVADPFPLVTKPGHHQAQRPTPWASSSQTGFRAAATASARNEVKTNNASRAVAVVPKPITVSETSFPELPSSHSAKARPPVSGNMSLKKMLRESEPPPSVWGHNDLQAAGAEDTPSNASVQEPAKGRKGKGKQKQTLFTIGSLPIV